MDYVWDWISRRTVKFWFIFLILIIALGIWAKCFQLIPPGHVGVKVNLIGESRGISNKTLGTGMHWIAPWVQVQKFPTYMQNHTWDSKNEVFNFQTSEGLSVDAHIGLSYHLDPTLVPVLFAQYRRGIDEITHIFLRNYIRDALNKTSSRLRIEDLYSSEKNDFMGTVEAYLKSSLANKGIIIDKLYLIGKFHLPESVVMALNLKIEAIQRAHQRENELKESEAFARKQIAIAQGEAEATLVKAEAEAKSNALVAQSVTERLILLEAIKKWDGKLPQTMADGISLLMDQTKGK